MTRALRLFGTTPGRRLPSRTKVVETAVAPLPPLKVSNGVVGVWVCKISTAQPVGLGHLKAVLEQESVADAVRLPIIRAAQRNADIAWTVSSDRGDSWNHRQTFLDDKIGSVFGVLPVYRGNRLGRRGFGDGGYLSADGDALGNDVETQRERDVCCLPSREIYVLIYLVEAKLVSCDEVRASR